ncbi:hypothetical protein D3C79_854640 [compost metagenome]
MPELRGRRVGGHLLDLAFDTALRFVLDDHPRAIDDVPVQLGLARAVAAHGIQVHAWLDHVRGQDGGEGLVGGHCGDDIGAANRFGHGTGDAHPQFRECPEVGDQLGAGLGVEVVQADFIDTQQGVESQGLEFAL